MEFDRVPDCRTRWPWPKLRGPHRAAATVAIALFAFIGLAATTHAVVDLMRWRDAGHLARTVAADAKASDQERVDAIVVMLRDAHESVALLRQISGERGAVGQDARNAVDALRRAVR